MENKTLDVLVIEPGGEVYEQTIASGCKPLQELVGGLIECPPCDDSRLSIFINEEGKLIGLEPNFYGTAVWYAATPVMRGQDMLCGTVVVTGGVDDNGDTMSIPDDMRDAIVLALTNLSVVQ